MKYLKIRDELVGLLEVMTPGEPLPPERELAARLGVSRMTLRRGVDELVASGRAIRKQGAGVFAAAPKVSQALAATSFSEEMRRRGLRPGARTLNSAIVPAGGRIGQRLDVPPEEPVLRVERLRVADEAPMAVEVLHVAAELVPGLDGADLADSSFYELLASRYGLHVAGGLQTVEPTVTDETESVALEVPLHSPALLCERVSRTHSGRIIEFVRSVYRGDRYRIEMDIAPAQRMAPAAVADDRRPATHG